MNFENEEWSEDSITFVGKCFIGKNVSLILGMQWIILQGTAYVLWKKENINSLDR